MRRNKTGRLGLLLAVVVLIAASAFFAGRRLHSAPSIPHRIVEPVPTVTVGYRKLVDRLVLKAAVSLPHPWVPQLVAPQLAPTALPLVTASSLTVGSEIVNGSVLVYVAGVPIIAMQGTTPMYRELSDGDSGSDVAQFQNGLEQLGYSIDDTPGVYGPSTALAAAAVFSHDGYKLPTRVTGTGKQRVIHVLVPAANVYFFPSLPVRVVKTALAIRQSFSATGLTVTTSRPVVRATGSAVQTGAVRPGMHVVLTGGGTRIRAIVGRVTAAGARLRLAAGVRTPRPGTTFAATIVRRSTGRKVLVVPSVAVGPCGTGECVRRRSGPTTQSIPVAVRMSVGGYDAVHPTGSARLSAGDQVYLQAGS